MISQENKKNMSFDQKCDLLKEVLEENLRYKLSEKGLNYDNFSMIIECYIGMIDYACFPTQVSSKDIDLFKQEFCPNILTLFFSDEEITNIACNVVYDFNKKNIDNKVKE